MASDVGALADALQGTCMSIEDGCEQVGIDHDAMTVEEHQELDGLVFLCDQCGWWCEACEANENPGGGGDLCDDCAEED